MSKGDEMRVVAVVFGFLCVACAILLSIRPIPDERGVHYSFWGRTLPMSLGAVVVGSVLLHRRRWVSLSFMFGTAAVLVRVMTYFVFQYG